MRGDGAGALRGAPRLQQHHRLHRRRRAQRLEEAPAVRHALDVAGDDARLGVRGHRVEDIRLGDVGLVAEAREEREAHAALARPVEDGDGERAGVRDEGDAARLRHARREGEVEAARRPDPAEAVRPEDADRLIAEPRAQLGLARPPLLAGLPEARGDHHRAGHALGDALLERGQHRRSGHGDHGEVHRSLDGEDRGRGPDALHHVRVRIDREDPPGEARRAQVGEHAASDLGGIAGGADHRDAGWIEEGRERGARHLAAPCANHAWLRPARGRSAPDRVRAGPRDRPRCRGALCSCLLARGCRSPAGPRARPWRARRSPRAAPRCAAPAAP